MSRVVDERTGAPSTFAGVCVKLSNLVHPIEINLPAVWTGTKVDIVVIIPLSFIVKRLRTRVISVGLFLRTAKFRTVALGLEMLPHIGLLQRKNE
jgi:hypothetical protein